MPHLLADPPLSELRDDHRDPETVTTFLDPDREFAFQQIPPFPLPWRQPLASLFWTVKLLFGLVSLFAFLAVLAAIPVVNFLALGYLLEAEGRVARTGKLRNCFPLLALTPTLGMIVLGVAVWLLPVMFAAHQASIAALIDPASPQARGWEIARRILAVLIAAHLTCALARGGSFWCFVRPWKNLFWLLNQLRQGTYFQTANAAVLEFVRALRIPHHFWLGLRGFVGAGLWLMIPSALLATFNQTTRPIQLIPAFLGAGLLILVFSWVPFLQARFAAENRFGAFRELGTIRQLYRRTPLLWVLAIVVTFALSLPLYLTKVAWLPQDARWLITPIFIVGLYPARIFTGWVYARANRSESQPWRLWRWFCYALLPPLLAIYLVLLFLMPSFTVAGRRVLFEHPAMLLPSPF